MKTITAILYFLIFIFLFAEYVGAQYLHPFNPIPFGYYVAPEESTPAADSTILLNGDAETGDMTGMFVSWNNAVGTFTASGTDPISGDYSFLLDITSADGSLDRPLFTIEILPDSCYLAYVDWTIEFTAVADPGESLQIKYFYNGSLKLINWVITDSLQTFTYTTSRTTDRCTTVGFYVLTGESGTVKIDDIKVYRN